VKETNALQIIGVILGSGLGLGAIVLFILRWIRFKSKDNADVNRINAESGKINAESDRLRAEANEIKSKAEVSVADAALKLAERLGEQVNDTRMELEETSKKLHETETELYACRRIISINEETIKTIRAELDRERIANRELQAEIEQLKLEIQKIKKSSG
jgi:outer membrane murein-binding lipoprotein Lpp